MRTSGDEGAPADASPQGLKGLWIDTILDALEAGEIDLAVHSAKDLPAEDDDGLRDRRRAGARRPPRRAGHARRSA